MLLPIFYTTNRAFPQSRFPKLAEPVFTYFRAVVFLIYTVASATFPGMSAPISRHENRFSPEDNFLSPIDNEQRKG